MSKAFFLRYAVMTLVALFASIMLLSPNAHSQISFEYRLDSFFAGQHREPANSITNPGNRILKIPEWSLNADLRPDLRVLFPSYGILPASQLTVRPRMIFDQSWIPYPRSEGIFDLTDAYVESRLSETLALTLGLEVYQWGPAELYNASNPLFHLRTANRSAFFKEKGEALIRLSFDPSTLETEANSGSTAETKPSWNTMLILNPVSNNEPSWRSGDNEFKPSGFLKSEITSGSSQGNYLGANAGWQPDHRFFIGEYLNHTWESGVSIYVDSRHPFGKRRFTPTQDALFQIELKEVENDSTIETLGILGIRYEGRADLRFEYLYNSQGFSVKEFGLAVSSLKQLNAQLPTNYARFLQPGLEILGQNILYTSVRIPDLGPSADSSIFIRNLLSLQDFSSAIQVAIEKPISDAMVLNLEGNASIGPDESEFTLYERYQAIIGVKWTL